MAPDAGPHLHTVHDPAAQIFSRFALLLNLRAGPGSCDQSGCRRANASTAFGRRLTELGYAFPTRPGFVHGRSSPGRQAAGLGAHRHLLDAAALQ
jgi:hypothetical protein